MRASEKAPRGAAVTQRQPEQRRELLSGDLLKRGAASSPASQEGEEHGYSGGRIIRGLSIPITEFMFILVILIIIHLLMHSYFFAQLTFT